MNINRHNYEEFFLLYTDNELQPEERLQVQEFVAQNPDLADELSILRQTILSAPEMHFSNKVDLFREEQGINSTNYQEYFLLYADNELNTREANETETFVLQHPDLQNEFTLISKSKLEPPHIIFDNKHALYRNVKVRKLYPALWLRLSGAAAIAGLIAFTWLFSKNELPANNPDVASIKKPAQLQKKVNKVSTIKNLDTSLLNIAAGTSTFVQSNTKQPVKYLEVPKTLSRKYPMAKNERSIALHQPKKVIGTENNETQKLDNGNEDENTDQGQNESIALRQSHRTNNDQPNRADDILQLAHAQNMEGQPGLVTNTVYRELDTNEDDRSLYISSAAINKNKLKGLFKKAASLFGRSKNNNDSDSDK